MRVTVCQIDPRPERLEVSMRVVGDHVGDHGTELLVLPEMPFSDWLATDREPDPERWAGSVAAHLEWIDRLGECGAPAVLATRPTIEASGSRRNEAFLWTDGGGAVPIHQKYHLPDEPGYWEHSWYDRGPRRFDTARSGEALVGVQICTELWFLEWARHYAAERVDILATPRATPRTTTDKWIAGGRVAAVCSGAYSVSSNLWHPDGVSAECGGAGWVIDPEGTVLATTSIEAPCATVEIDLEFTRRSKATYPRYVSD